ncbi:Sec-independent protein translocase protein TatB [Candidatus Endowatersipora endosymbiont of Watersipora subatra]|uniref:Sec-independent protein translocase protein TatB n=1 Tax=Candidatus Endowatersipora endosymbiont of Watersipora subatra TaxID=3077946 RepID=UPI00312C8345
MFDIGWPEMLLVSAVTFVVVGPKDLPRVLNCFGHVVRRLRFLVLDFQKRFDESLKGTCLDEVKSDLDFSSSFLIESPRTPSKSKD